MCACVCLPVRWCACACVGTGVCCVQAFFFAPELVSLEAIMFQEYSVIFAGAESVDCKPMSHVIQINSKR